jgi:hypothetical protein
MDLQVSREIKAAALQAIRYVQLLTLSQIIPTITIKMINIIAGKKYHSRRRAFKIYALSIQEQIPLSHSVAKPSVHQEFHPTPQQSATSIVPSSKALSHNFLPRTQQRSHQPLLTLSAKQNSLNY